METKMTLTEQEIVELNGWIAVNVMKWESVFSGLGFRYWHDGYEFTEWVSGEAIPYPRKLFKPTTDPAAAMLVLERCLEKEELVISKSPHGFLIESHDTNQYETCDSDIYAEAPTLPLAICLFAKQLFGGEA
jgi:hypothetical protein